MIHSRQNIQVFIQIKGILLDLLGNMLSSFMIDSNIKILNKSKNKGKRNYYFIFDYRNETFKEKVPFDLVKTRDDPRLSLKLKAYLLLLQIVPVADPNLRSLLLVVTPDKAMPISGPTSFFQHPYPLFMPTNSAMSPSMLTPMLNTYNYQQPNYLSQHLNNMKQQTSTDFPLLRSLGIDPDFETTDHQNKINNLLSELVKLHKK